MVGIPLLSNDIRHEMPRVLSDIHLCVNQSGKAVDGIGVGELYAPAVVVDIFLVCVVVEG